MNQEQRTSQETPKSYYQQLGEVFIYPVTGRGKYIILGFVVLLAIMYSVRLILKSVLGMTGMYVGIAFIGIGAILGMYFCCYMLKVVGSSAGGEDDPPDWPDVSDPWGDLVHPLLLMLSSVVLAFAPAILCRLLGHYYGLPHMQTLMWCFIVGGLLYLPMELLAVSLMESVAGLNPIVVVSSIFRVGAPYLVACLMMVLVFVLGVLTFQYIFPHVPVLGGVLAPGLIMYLLMAQMRILGLIYRYHEDRLGWFTVD